MRDGVEPPGVAELAGLDDEVSDQPTDLEALSLQWNSRREIFRKRQPGTYYWYGLPWQGATVRVELAPGLLLHLLGVGQEGRRLQRLGGGGGRRQLLGARGILRLRERSRGRVCLAGETSLRHGASHLDTGRRDWTD